MSDEIKAVLFLENGSYLMHVYIRMFVFETAEDPSRRVYRGFCFQRLMLFSKGLVTIQIRGLWSSQILWKVILEIRLVMRLMSI